MSQLFPLQVNERTGEPFLRLPSPHENIIITPPRMEDAASAVRNLSDPRVYKTLQGPPFPYRYEDAIDWLQKIRASSDTLLKELQEAAQEGLGEPKIVNGCPVRSLREVHEDGSDTFIGDIGTHRCTFTGVADEEERNEQCRRYTVHTHGSPQ